MVGKAFSQHRAAHPLALEIDFGDEIDRALLVDMKAGRAPCQLNGTGLENDFNRGSEEDRIRWMRRSVHSMLMDTLWCGSHALDHDDFHAALRGSLQHHFVHEAADQENAAATRLQ